LYVQLANLFSILIPYMLNILQIANEVSELAYIKVMQGAG